MSLSPNEKDQIAHVYDKRNRFVTDSAKPKVGSSKTIVSAVFYSVRFHIFSRPFQLNEYD